MVFFIEAAKRGKILNAGAVYLTVDIGPYYCREIAAIGASRSDNSFYHQMRLQWRTVDARLVNDELHCIEYQILLAQLYLRFGISNP